MKSDEDDKSEEKNTPVKHFLIDLRFMLLKPKIEIINEMYKTETNEYELLDYSKNGYSQYQMSVFLQAINQVYK